MELIAIKTRVMHPPHDDLFEVIDTSVTDIRDGDVAIVTSKVVAIHEGRCVPIEGTDKKKLMEQEAEYLYTLTWRDTPLAITNDAIIGQAGIDESNGNGYYILLPKDSYASAQSIRTHLMTRHKVTRLGVIVTDSHSLPFRYGAMSISIGCWGFEPIQSHIGRPDLFGRTMQYSKTNIPDSIAAAATLISGECDEVQPIQIARGIPNLVWTDNDPRTSFIIPRSEDIYRDLYRDFKKP
jgi:dihydrofolate synthase / folylpolyglutamate synthase